MTNAAVRTLAAGSLLVLALSSLTGCCVIRRLRYGTNADGSLRTAPAEELHLLEFTNDCETAIVDAQYSGTGGPGAADAASPAFEPVAWTAVPPRGTMSVTTFTLGGIAVRPKPASIRFTAGPRSGTVTAAPGRFIASVKAFLMDRKLVVVAAQDDGTNATVSFDPGE